MRNAFLLAAALGAMAGAPLAQAQAAPAFPPSPALSAAQRGAIEQVVREFLLANPEVLAEAQQALQAREQAARAERARKALAGERAALFDDPHAPVAGNPRGDVTVVEFFDYACPHCKRAAASVKTLLAQDPGVRVVYRELPILGPESFYAARAALAAQRQHRYREFHDALMAAEDGGEAAVKRIAAALGLDHARLVADMERPEIAAQIEQSHRIAEVLELGGTPAFVVGGTLVPGGIGPEALLQLVREEREKLRNTKGARP